MNKFKHPAFVNFGKEFRSDHGVGEKASGASLEEWRYFVNDVYEVDLNKLHSGLAPAADSFRPINQLRPSV